MSTPPPSILLYASRIGMSPAGRDVSLPEEVWERIARRFTIREWAAVCGTCRTMANVQFESVHECHEIAPAGIEWLSKRWSRMRALRLESFGEGSAKELARFASKSRFPLRIQDMAVDISKDNPQACLMLLSSALAKMQQLQFPSVRLWSGQLIWVPPLLQIRHLILQCNCITDAGIIALALLTNLQTLAINEMYSDMAPETLIDLRPLQQLKRMRLDNVFCKKIKMPQQCQLHLTLPDAIPGMDNLGESNLFDINVWSDIMASLHSVFCKEDYGHLKVPLPAFLMAPSKLRYVDLVCDGVGSADAPLVLEGALLKATVLHIQANVLFLHLTAGVVVEELGITSKKHMCLSCKDIRAFLDGGTAFSISYKSIEGSFIPELCKAMAARGMAWDIGTTQRGDTEFMYKPATARAGMFRFECPCECCAECLARAGLVHEIHCAR